MTLSINERAFNLVREMLDKAEELKIEAFEAECGATVVDCGVKPEGSIEAGLYLTRIAAGDLLSVFMTTMNYGESSLPALYVSSDNPVLATFGGQLGDWEVKDGEYFAIGSGPARALALDREIPQAVRAKRDLYRRAGLVTYTPREIYERIGYADSYDKAVIVLESSEIPPDRTLRFIAEKCYVKPSNLYALVAPTNSISGAVQIAGRIVEVGIHKLALLGFDFTRIVFGSGCSPMAPVHPDVAEAMGRTNDAIRYGGITYYVVNHNDDKMIEKFVKKVPPRDNKSFAEIFKGARGFYDVDLLAFAPAVITVNNLKTGRTCKAGHVNIEFLMKTMSVQQITQL